MSKQQKLVKNNEEKSANRCHIHLACFAPVQSWHTCLGTAECNYHREHHVCENICTNGQYHRDIYVLKNHTQSSSTQNITEKLTRQFPFSPTHKNVNTNVNSCYTKQAQTNYRSKTHLHNSLPHVA